MSLNLITDAWIPVRCADGSRRTIAPWEMADDTIIAPDWPRPDLNIACYEMLIGLVYMADPPEHIDDWNDDRSPNPDRLREKLLPFAPAFNLLGNGPLFMQDYESFTGEGNGVDMLFIDSAGESAAKKNTDLMVHRDRYADLDFPTAAMAIYTLQTFAPSGGAGNRTSMRGGGPLVTLVMPDDRADPPLWNVVWANVPYGSPGDMRQLPWMHATKVSSSEGSETLPPDGTFDIQAFFGMPRRLRLRHAGGRVVDVVQKPYGTNYAMWKHPLSPYYRQKVGTEWLPKHPRAGVFGYRSWLGIVAAECGDNPLSELALCLRTANERIGVSKVIVAGWAMDNMKPRDFTLSMAPYVELDNVGAQRLQGLIEAADAAALALRGALEPVLKDGEEREAQREQFFLETETRFRGHVEKIKAGNNPSADWLADLRRQALRQFDDLSLPLIAQSGTAKIKKLVDARKFLGLAFAGYGKQGKAIYAPLDIQLPEKKGKA